MCRQRRWSSQTLRCLKRPRKMEELLGCRRMGRHNLDCTLPSAMFSSLSLTPLPQQKTYG